MGKALKPILIGAAIIGVGVATGGISLAASGSAAGFLGGTLGGGVSILGATLSTTGLGGLALAAGASQILGGIEAAAAKAPKTALAAIDRLNASLVPGAYRKIAFGRTALATDIRYVEPSGADQEYIDYIIALAAHRIASVDELWIEDRIAWTAAGGVVADYAGYLTVDVRLEGTAANTIAINGGAKWGANRRLTGCAYLHLRIRRTGTSKKAASPFANGLPSRLTIVGGGMPLYDPRYDSTVPGGAGPQRATDQATWAYQYDGRTQGYNPALQILAYLLGWRINGKVSVGSGVPVARIDLPSFLIAANLCDEAVTKADGTSTTRYLSAGVASENDDPQQLLGALAAACNGRLRDTGGKLSLAIMHNDLAAAAADDGLTDDDVLSAFEWNPDPSLEQSYNVVRGRYTDPSAGSLYQLVDYPEIRAFDMPDGIDRVLPLDLANVQWPDQAQRLAKQALQRIQYQRSFSATFGARAWKYQVGDIVPFTFAALGFQRRLFRVAQTTIAMDGTCPMVLIEENPAIYAWDREEAAAVTAAAPVRYDPNNSPLILGIAQAGTTATWGGVTGDGRPDDFATYGAPGNAPVGSSTGDAVVTNIATNAQNLQLLAQRVTPIEQLLAPSGSIQQQINAINAELDAGGDDTVTLSRITALEAATRQGAPNLIVNSDYSDYDPNTGIIRGWTKSGSGWVVLPSDRGTFVQISGGFGATLRQNVPAYGGNGYSFGVEADPDDPQGSQTYLEWRGNSGQPLGTTPSLYADGWVRAVSTVFQAPPGTASAEIVLRQNASGGASVSRWSRVQVQLGEPTLWSDPATMRSNAARITSEEIARAGQTAVLASRTTTIEAQVAGTAGSYLKSAIETVSTTASNQYGTVSQQINTLTSSIGALNAPNLLDNGRFDNGFSGWTLSGGGSGWQVVTAYSEPFAQFTGSYGYAYKDYSGVTFSKPYCASFSGSPDSSNAELAYIEWWADGYAQYLGRVEVPWAGTERAAGGPFYPPSNTKIARVGIQTTGSGTGSRRWWKILFQQSATPTDYADTASLGGLQAQVTTQAGTLASIGGQVNTQGGQLGALSGTVAGQVTGLNNLTTKVSVRTLAYWASEATTGGTSAFITGRAEMSDGTVTSSVAIGAKEFSVYNEVNGTYVRALGVVGGNVLIYGNLAVSGSVSAYNLKFGATGNVSKYYFQPYNDNAQTDWSAGPMGVGIVSQEGAPIEGRAIMTATNIGTAGGITYLKVIRTSDGVAVYGGDNGIPYRFPSDGTFMSVPIEFTDSVNAGQRAQYDVRVKQTGGAITRTIARIETIREMVRDRFDELWIAAPAGQGPGAGSAGGGQINGDGSGDGGTGGTIGTRTPTGGGLAWKQIET